MLNEEKSASGEKQKDLPKPQTDLPRGKAILPLPEKEITEKSDNQPKSSIFKSKFFLLFIAISFLIAFLIGGFIIGKNNAGKQVACTLEAKICPDGSSVGRTGPNCEFTKCPTTTTPTTDPTADWKTYTSPIYNPYYDASSLQKEIQRIGPNDPTVKNIQFSIKYPPDWSQEFFDNANPSEFDGGFTGSNGFKFYKGNLQIRIGKFYAPGGNGCFNDETQTQYETIKTSFADFARFSIYKGAYPEKIPNGYTKFHICEGPGYQETSELGGITFLVPNDYSDENIKTMDKIISTLKFTNPAQPTQSFIEIPEYGVKFALTDNIKEAYYLPSTADKGYVYLKVHSLDNESQCAKDDSSTAALSKVGKDEVNPMSGEKYSSAGNGVIIGNNYYYIDLAQYECAESVQGKALLTKVRKAFSDASSTITKL